MTRWTDSSDVDTVELPTPPDPSATTRRRGGLWRDLSGALAIGISVLALVVVVFQVLAWGRAMPGPGLAMVAGHLGAAVFAVLVQRLADRRAGWVAALSTIAVIAVTGLTLWLYWWA